jgi:hypothetical protein
MLTRIKFTANGCCSAIGNFSSGDTARVSAEMARHLVEEAKCAKYDEPAPQADAAPVAEQSLPRKRKGR